jgi:hypothetical protein
MNAQAWAALAERMILKNPGGDPISVMVRASWKHSKRSPERATSDDEWNDLIRGDVQAMVASLERAGYRIVAAHASAKG